MKVSCRGCGMVFAVSGSDLVPIMPRPMGWVVLYALTPVLVAFAAGIAAIGSRRLGLHGGWIGAVLAGIAAGIVWALSLEWVDLQRNPVTGAWRWFAIAFALLRATATAALGILIIIVVLGALASAVFRLFA